MKKAVSITKRGSVYIEFIVSFFCIAIVLAFALNLLPAFIKYQNLINFANAAVRTAELLGTTDIDARLGELKEDTKINPGIKFDGTEYISYSHKVQLNNKIVVTLTDSCDIGFFTFGSFNVPLRVQKTGRSEVYYK